MARRRMLDPGFWDDEDAGKLSNDARLLLIACISNADDYGKISGSTATLKKIAFGFTDMTTADTERLLDEIATTLRGFHRYTVDGKPYVALLHWHKYQRVDHPQASLLPDPPDAQFDPVEFERNQKRTEDDSEGHSENRSKNHSKSAARQLINQVPTNESTCPPTLLQLVDRIVPGQVNSSWQSVVRTWAETYGEDEVRAVLTSALAAEPNSPRRWIDKVLTDRAKQRASGIDPTSTMSPQEQAQLIRARERAKQPVPEIRIPKKLEVAG